MRDRVATPPPFILTAIRVGVDLTLLAGVFALAQPFVPGSSVEHLVPYEIVVVGVLLLGVLVHRIPWTRLLDTAWFVRLYEGWGVLLAALISAGVVASGGPAGQGHLYLYLVLVLFGSTLPWGGALRLLAVTCGGVVWIGFEAGLGIGQLLTRLVVLTLTGYVARLLGRALLEQKTAAETARSVAERRAELLEIVAGSARSVSTLDLETALEQVVAAAVRLGFEAGDICLLVPDEDVFEVRAPVGIHELSYTSGRHPADAGLHGRVRRAGETVVVENYSELSDALPGLRDGGFQATVAVPIWTDRFAGCLVVGSRVRSSVAREEVEALELLAALAGRALQNAQQFENEHETVQRLAQLNQLKSDFVSNVSHELRTPLTVIEGISATMLRRPEAIGESLRDELVQRLHANAVALDEILTRLLDFARLEAGTLKLEVEDTRMDLLVTAVADRVADIAREHVLDVRAPAPAAVQADPVLLERVVENLAVNALKHTPAGTRVLVYVEVCGTDVEIGVMDDGPGIPEPEIAHLTERFFRGGDPNTRARKGLGLGLALVAELVAMHGSRLEIGLGPDGGAHFWFVLPRSVEPRGLAARYAHEYDPRRGGTSSVLASRAPGV